jgi:hypothetical protein
MSAIIFDSFKSLYNYYYQVGKDWTSPNQAMPEKRYACLIKVQIEKDEPNVIKAFFSERGWVDSKGSKIDENWSVSIIEWKYDPSTKSQCTIL